MKCFRILVGILALMVVSVVPAAIVQHDTLSSWETAIGGPGNLSEDFEGFVVDTDFRLNPVDLSLGTIVQDGYDAGFRNFVDVPPFTYTDNGGTNHASSFVNAFEASPAYWPEPGAGDIDTPPDAQMPEFVLPATNVRVMFTGPVNGWGAQFYGCLGAELLAIDVLGPGDTVLATLLPANTNGFCGFTTSAGEVAMGVLLHSQTVNPGSGGEGFGMDDMVAETGGGGGVPATTTTGLVVTVFLILAISAVVLLRRRSLA
jgi:hypothetical protein